MASRPVTAATMIAGTPRPAASACVRPATWISSVSTSVTTPKGPMSDRRITSSAPAAGRRLPSPSARSARPSRCRPRLSTASDPTASTAATSDPVCSSCPKT